jgi:pSer/pThr/pTyr-binding forkhead associated (FHA) protein
MAKLIVSAEGEVVSQRFLEEGVLTIGRGEDNSLVLDDERVSRQHATITTVAQDEVLADLKSANGTFVNGSAIDTRILQHGDVIELGRFRLKYLNPKVVQGAAFDRTMMTAPMQEAAVTHVDAAVPARHTEVNSPLGVIKDAATGEEIELSRVLHVIGVPQRHFAIINRRPRGYFLTHALGRRGPRVNGKRIGREPRLLKSGDIIEIAGMKHRFFIHD